MDQEPGDKQDKTIRILIALVGVLCLVVFLCIVGVVALGSQLWNVSSDPPENPTGVPVRVAIANPADSNVKFDEPVTQGNDTDSKTLELPGLPNALESKDGADSKGNAISSARYNFNVRSSIIFDYSSKVKVGYRYSSDQGRVQYKILKTDAKKYIDQLGESEKALLNKEGNGSGFVVHPDGLVVTCAHVVDGFSNVSVSIGDKKFDGKVVAIDQKNDLALVKIDESGLKFLPISIADTKLGTEARIFGFPLADQLGKSLKMATGSVTGKDRVDDKSIRLHLDATANPGNSGGPVTDKRGRVIGVVDSILASSQLSNMSFAVPTDALCKLLTKNKIPFLKLDDSASIENNEGLAVSSLEEVGDAVALIEIRSSDQAKNWRVMKVSVSNIHKSNWSQASPAPGGRVPSGRNIFQGELVVDWKGNVLYVSKLDIIPFVFENLATIGIQPLPEYNSNRWETDDSMLLSREKTKAPNRDPFRFGAKPFSPFNRFDNDQVTKQFLQLVSIKNEYRAKKHAIGISIDITKDIKTKDLGNVEDALNLNHSLDGKAIFNSKTGWFDTGKLSGDIRFKHEGKILEGKIEYQFDRIGQEKVQIELAEEKAKTDFRKKAKQDLIKKLDQLQKGTKGLDQFDPGK